MASSSPSGAYAATKLYDQCLRGMATVPTTVHTKTLQFEEIVNLFLSGNHAIATNALIEFTNEALFAFYLGEGKDGVDGQDSLLDEIIKISEKFSSHLVSDVINFSTQRMRAYNCYRNGDFEMVIKILNPLIGKCPMQNGNHVAGLADLLIILSEAFAELSSFDDAMHSARLSAYIAHKRVSVLQTFHMISFDIYSIMIYTRIYICMDTVYCVYLSFPLTSPFSIHSHSNLLIPPPHTHSHAYI